MSDMLQLVVSCEEEFCERQRQAEGKSDQVGTASLVLSCFTD